MGESIGVRRNKKLPPCFTGTRWFSTSPVDEPPLQIVQARKIERGAHDCQVRQTFSAGDNNILRVAEITAMACA
jgi:hypothetical protein